MQHKFLPLFVFAIFLMVAAACSGPGATSPRATTAPTAVLVSTAAPTTQPARAVLEKASCPFNAPDGQTVECGYVTVPEDHFNATARTIRLPVAVFKSKSGPRPPDPLVMLCGGPGEKCFDNAPLVAYRFASVLGGRDFVVFDQRGAGRSQPALDCPEWEQAFLNTLAETNMKTRSQATFDAWTTCRERLAREGYNLALYNTTQNAADVKAIRTALGYQQVNLYGGSYGSLLAQAVMRDYPAGVRSAVIDSVLPLEKSFFVDVPANSSAAILRLVESCAADKECNAAYPNLKDVLFKTIEQLNAKPASLSITDPASGKSYNAALTGYELVSNLTFFLYLTDILPALPQTIYDVSNGKYDLMARLSGVRLAALHASSRGMMLSVLCAEDLINRTPDDLKATVATVPPQLAVSPDWEMVEQFGIFATCKNWNVKQADPSVKKPLVSDIPTLVISGEFDPVTPSTYSRLVAGYLSKSVFFEFPGVGHSVGMADECARNIARSFLDNPTASPDAVCIAKVKGIAFDLPSKKPPEVKLAPFTNETIGVSGVLPIGWKETIPRNFVRRATAVDSTVLVLDAVSATSDKLLAALAKQLGFDPALKPAASAEFNGLQWSFYVFSVEGRAGDLAIAESSGKAYFVLLLSAPEERAALYDQVFQPVVKALKPIK
jgi:pimeloyl-ACP methyl ester carboxylesterase